MQALGPTSEATGSLSPDLNKETTNAFHQNIAAGCGNLHRAGGLFCDHSVYRSTVPGSAMPTSLMLVAAALPNDRINVRPGTYKEYVIITEPLSITGNNATVGTAHPPSHKIIF